MTTIGLEERTCSLCGASHEYRIIYSTNTFGGGPDLDLRPGEMQRSTMPMWVQQCPDCGYCAHDITHLTPGAAEIIESTPYNEIRFNDHIPELAKSFLLLALLNESDHRVSALARLRAAWVCDDAGLVSLASDYRTLAINDMARRAPFPDTEEGVSEGAVYIDMLRRTQRFDEALKMIKQLLAHSAAKDIVQQVLEYERSLCEQKNTDSKRVADATAT